MTDTTALVATGGSPFDAIRQIRPDGTEFWSARSLQVATGYSRWEDFAKIIDRAITSARNSGHDAAASFAAITEKPSGGGRPRQDYQLSRFGAYLTVMNGDPNMPEVAAAQAYFAIRTREAESRPSTPSVPTLTPLEYALALVEAEKRALEAQAQAEAGAKFKRAIEGGDGLTLREFHKKYFSAVTEATFMSHLYRNGHLINQIGKGSLRTEGKKAGTRRDGTQHRHPTYKGKQFFYLHSGGVHGGRRRESTRVRPGEWELLLRDQLAKEGLDANENTTGLFGIEGAARAKELQNA